MVSYQRVLLKLSGEVFAGGKAFGIDFDTVMGYASQLKELVYAGIQLGVVIGAGNIWRGRSATFMDRPAADKMGMLATVMNALVLRDALRESGVSAVVYSSFGISDIADSFNRLKAIDDLASSSVVIFAGGTGSPYFTTDTAAALKALEVKADLLLKGTKVKGVYDKDPVKFDDAIFFSNLSYSEVLKRNLKVMDLTAISLCRENNLPILVCDVTTPGNLLKAVRGENIGTLVKEES